MITALHAMIYSSDPDATRAFFRDVLRFPHVDAGHGWLIFALPPAELGIHPTSEPGEPESVPPGHHQLYLMCDDIEQTVADLRARGVEFSAPVSDQGWGLLTSFKLPGAADLHLYQPRHPTAVNPASRPA
jgi:catechol 2,3-dioxygenase-like lactoylglutathione lyase family enzyme